MNIFVLDQNPIVAAQHMCNKHVVKMIVESCQLLSTAHHVLDGKKITRVAKNGRNYSTYECVNDLFTPNILRCTMVNHPCTIWVRSSHMAYNWLWLHVRELLDVYSERYEKIHSYYSLVQFTLIKHPKNIPHVPIEPFAQAMPDKYKNNDAVNAYRAYYIGEKSRFAKWPDGKTPSWYLDGIKQPAIISA